MKQQNIEITPETFFWYAENFPSARQGMTIAVTAFRDSLEAHPVATMFSDPLTAHNFMLDVWKMAWRHSLVSMKGMFTARELSLLIDTHNGLAMSALHYSANTLAAGTSDSIALDGMAEKWEIDGPALIEKIHTLTPMQALCLEIWANGFWYGRNQAKGLEDYVAQLA
ncbi:hypothetical protein [Desulfobacter postgatei]|uniref:hypothetical protein n=1 Tax=Desulfobacter postgatei TaxID=2293 RepID=UPI002FDB02FD